MSKVELLPNDLDFIKQPASIDAAMFRGAAWLLSDFMAPIWKCQFVSGSENAKTINFNVRLDDGLLLIDRIHESLLVAIKSYLCLMSHPLATGGIELAPKTINRRVNCALHLVDYFLLRADHFGLSLHGFKMVTANDIAALMTVMAGGQFVKANLYAAYEEAKFFLKHKARLLTDAEVGYVVAQVPGIGDVDTLGDRKLALSDAELVRARVYLWLNGYFNPKTCISGSDGHSFYRHQLSPQRLFAAVYQGRILSSCRFQGIAVEELHFNPIERRLREYPMVPTQMGSDDAATNERIFNEYYLALKKMELLSLSGLEYIRPYALSALDNRAFLGQLNMKEAGRYRSLPPEMAFAAFRQAAEFYFEYGECLIGAYLALVREASLQQVGISSLSQADLLRLLPAKLTGAGIRLWDLSAQYRGHVDEGSGRFFQRFRANEGLLQLIDVLYGSIWVIVATLTARRSGELLGLSTGQCLLEKSQGHYVCFDLRKRNIGGIRERVIRPIPKLAAQCILSLCRLHQQLSVFGHDLSDNTLFSKPHYQEIGLVVLHNVELAKVLNRFCDYFELPTDSAGRRYYIRTHQLRRFFAMMFFWAGGFGGLDTLRWFLGHTDVEHVYRYITETVPGAIFRRASAEYASACLRRGESKADGLGTLLRQRYGLSSFTLMQSDEVADYLEDLVVEGVLKIEPVFFDTPKGKRYEVLFKVIGVAK